MTRVAVHLDNKRKGDPKVWLVEQNGQLYAAEKVWFLGPTWTQTGKLPHGPTLWVETKDPVVLRAAEELGPG